jgi:hypothetical protein
MKLKDGNIRRRKVEIGRADAATCGRLNVSE